MNDRVALAKRDGTRHEGVRALVQPNMIFIDDPALPVEEGNHIERSLPNGLLERYLILDRGFHSAVGGIAAHYQARVRKEGSLMDTGQPAQVYNVHGHNARINVNSHDQSTNLSVAGDLSVFDAARRAVESSGIPAEDRGAIVQTLSDLRTAAGTPDFVQRYQQFITAAANHMTVLGPFLPAITQFLHR